MHENRSSDHRIDETCDQKGEKIITQNFIYKNEI